MINLLIALFLMVLVCLFVVASIYYVRANRFQNAALKWKSKMWLPTFQSRREYDIDFDLAQPKATKTALSSPSQGEVSEGRRGLSTKNQITND